MQPIANELALKFLVDVCAGVSMQVDNYGAIPAYLRLKSVEFNYVITTV